MDTADLNGDGKADPAVPNLWTYTYSENFEYIFTSIFNVAENSLEGADVGTIDAGASLGYTLTYAIKDGNSDPEGMARQHLSLTPAQAS